MAKLPRHKKRAIDHLKLREFVAARNLSYPELTERINEKFPGDGVSLFTIQKIMIGQATGSYVAWKIAKAFNKPPDYFLEKTA